MLLFKQLDRDRVPAGVDDPKITEVNQATLRYARLPETRIEVGRQKIELEPEIVHDLALGLAVQAADRYYLVAASLVCNRPGLPYRNINLGRQEKVTFVIRRVVPKNGQAADTRQPTGAQEEPDEYAFIKTTSGGVWKKLTQNQHADVSEGEEHFPLFSLDFADTMW